MPETAPTKRDWLPIWISIGSIVLSSVWLYLQLQVWKQEGHDHMLTAANIVVTLLLWGTLACAVYVYIVRAKRKLKAQADKFKDVSEELESSTDPGIESSKRAGAQARLLWHFEAEAQELERFLVEVHDKWIAAGEELIHPISTELRDWKDFSKDMQPEATLRDFKGLFAHHLGYLKLEFPNLESPVVKLGYPSNAKYHEVLYAIKDHAEALDRVAKQVWDANEPMKELDAKAS